MRCPLPGLLLMLALSALARPGLGQNTDLKPLLAGTSNIPLTMKLGDLDGDWRRVSISLPTDSSSMMAMYAAMMTGSASDVYYTQGSLVTMGGDEFMIAYHVPTPKVDFQALQRGGQAAAPVKLTAATTLTLALLSLHSISSLSDIRPFDMTQEIAESGSATLVQAQDADTESSTHLKQLGLAVLQYTEDNDEKLPPMEDAATIKKAIWPYVKSDGIFINPISHQPYVPNTSLSHRTLASFNSPAEMVLYYEASPAPDNTRALLFLDGHVKRVPETEWPRYKAASHVPNTPVPTALLPGDQ